MWVLDPWQPHRRPGSAARGDVRHRSHRWTLRRATSGRFPQICSIFPPRTGSHDDMRLGRRTGMLDFGSKWVRLARNVAKPGFFQMKFQKLQYILACSTILAWRAKMYWNLTWKGTTGWCYIYCSSVITVSASVSVSVSVVTVNSLLYILWFSDYIVFHQASTESE